MEYLRNWSARDRGLAEGLIAYQDSIGPHGIPWRLALDDDMDGWFEVEQHTDYAQAALDRFRQDRGSSDAEPGARLFVMNTRPPDL